MERREAKKLGLTTYNTGRPCKNGHTDKRYVNDGRCYSCNKEYHSRDEVVKSDRLAKKDHRTNNRDDHLEYMSGYNHLPHVKLAKQKFYLRKKHEHISED